MKKITLRKSAGWHAIAAMLLLFVSGVTVHAQNVTIRSNNGSCIASVPQGATEYDTFYKVGGFATWQHEQLTLVLTASDETGLTSNGQLSNPANNIFSSGEKIQIGKGAGNSAYPTCYLSLSLPKGYRFTGYSIVFSKARETKSLGSNSVTFNSGNETTRFGETNSTFDTYTTSGDVTNGGGTRTITRTSLTDDDMTNVLYFKLMSTSTNASERSLITFESAELYFTAEANYTPLTASSHIVGMSAVDIPFQTSKVDYGTIESRTYNGATRVSYSSANVKDLIANFTLYEEGSVVEGTDFDGVTGKVLEYKSGSISTQDDYFRIGATDPAGNDTEEHIYYIETPNYVVLSDNTTKNPIGYRIVEAEIDYKYGDFNTYSETQQTYSTFYISCAVRSGNGPGATTTTYYMNQYGGATTSASERALWFIDSEGYVRTGENGMYYLTNTNTVSGGANYAATTLNKSEAIQLTTSGNYLLYGTNMWLRYAAANNSPYFRFQNNTGNRVERTTSGSTTVTEYTITGTQAAQPYKLLVYDREGQNPQVVEVNSTNSSGRLYVRNMNNDAVKIGVVGTGLIQGVLTLQALDPYIDRMNVVCNDLDNLDVKMYQTFTASDFSVNGGAFYFYLPKGTENDKVQITFEDLYSKYADETYSFGEADHNSRFNFVQAKHYQAFTQSNNNSIYNNYEEAARPQLERLKVGTVGTTAFKFNNADELTNSRGILTEYPFSLATYAAEPNNGSFDEMYFVVDENDQQLTRYVFTTDETAYNIAPTTAVQHRAYAYYKMEVHVQTATYSPQIAFTKIYDDALFGDDDTVADCYGVTVTAVDGSGNPGFASSNNVIDKIREAYEKGEDDFGNTDVPKNENDLLLYVDFSQLAGIFHSSDEESLTIEEFIKQNSPNILVFLPSGTSTNLNNAAYKTGAGFQSANNILITDKHPFYSPYDIQVDAANYAYYERKVTTDKNGLVSSATIIMPFVLTVDGTGTHTNDDGTSFSLHTMQSSNAMKLDIDNETYSAYLPPISNVTLTTANTPYIVKVNDGAADEENNVSFVAKQFGSNIVATSAMNSDYTFSGETASGVDVEEAETYYFHPYGSFSGKQISKSGGHYYYFAANMFLCTDQLSKSTLKMLPFRAWFEANNSSNTKYLGGFGVIYDEGNGDEATAIKHVAGNPDLMLHAGKGYITITAAADQEVKIYSMSGINASTVGMQAGQTRTVAVPAGVYVVNGAKIIVK